MRKLRFREVKDLDQLTQIMRRGPRTLLDSHGIFYIIFLNHLHHYLKHSNHRAKEKGSLMAC